MNRMHPALLICSLAAACGKPGPPPIPSSQVTDFHTLYDANCSACHGPNGRNGAAQPLNDPLYLRVIPRDQLRRVTEIGVPGTSMPAFALAEGGDLYPKQVEAIVNGIEREWARPVTLNGATLPPYNAPNGNAERGQAVFEAACARCHGPQGRVGTVLDPSYLSLVSNQSLRTTIIAGRPLFGMPDWFHLSPRLSDQDVSNLVAWIASNRPGIAPSSSGPTTNKTESHQ